MNDEPAEMISPDAFTPKPPRELNDALGLTRRYFEKQLSDPSFGFIVVDFVCAENVHNQSRSFRVSLAHGRKFPDGSLHLFIPEPEGTGVRKALVARKLRQKLRHNEWPAEKTYVAYELDQIPPDVPTILRCPKHGTRPVDSQLILDTISEGTPHPRRVIHV